MQRRAKLNRCVDAFLFPQLALQTVSGECQSEPYRIALGGGVLEGKHIIIIHLHVHTSCTYYVRDSVPSREAA